MKLKTFSATTMADALAAVRRDLGPDAMILHTRSYRVGSWFGLGGKNMVEITASAGEPDRKPGVRRPRPDLHTDPIRETKPERSAPRARPAVGPAADDDRASVLGGETRVARSARDDRAHADPDPIEAVVRRAASIIEPKPILSATPPVGTAAKPPAPPPMASIPAIATRLVRRDDAPPVRIADATPPATTAPPARTPTERAEVGPASPVTPDRTAPTAGESPDAVRAQLAELQRMMGQVLESSRRTSLAVGKVDPRAVETVPAGPLLDLMNRMVDNDAPIEAVDAAVARVRDRLDPAELRDPSIVRQELLREIESTIEVKPDALVSISAPTATGRPRVITLVGPTGVGKTTTVAKLAAACKLRHGRRVGLITSDTYRIAAVEQLRTYAGIIGLPIKVVMSPEEMSDAVASMSGMDVIIVDTAGRSQHDARRLDELKTFVDAAGADETHLVLSSTVGETVLRRTAERFLPLGPDRVILTKLDEAVCTGHVLGLTGRIGLALSFVTVGQEVPDDIEPARADRLARVVLDGPGALFGETGGRA